MNIQQIKTIGLIDKWIDFTAKVVEVKEQKMRGKADNQRMMTKCKLTDSSGEVIGAWLEGTAGLGNTYTLSGMLSEYNNNKYIDWAKIKYTHPSQGGSVAPQDAPQNAPQSTSTGRKQDIRYPDVYAFPASPESQERMARCAAGEAASRVVAAMIIAKWNFPDEHAIDNKLLQLIDTMAQVFINGFTPAKKYSDQPPQDDQNIPW